MQGIDWSLFQPGPDIGATWRKGMAEGRETGLQYRQDNALAGLARDPNDPRAMQELAAIDPSAAWKFQDRAAGQQKAEQDQAAAALEEYQESIVEAANMAQSIKAQNPDMPDEQVYSTLRQAALQRRLHGADQMPEQFEPQYFQSLLASAEKLKGAEPTTFMRDAAAAGIEPGTPEFAAAFKQKNMVRFVPDGQGGGQFVDTSQMSGGGDDLPDVLRPEDFDDEDGGQPPAAGNFLDPLAPL